MISQQSWMRVGESLRANPLDSRPTATNLQLPAVLPVHLPSRTFHSPENLLYQILLLSQSWPLLKFSNQSQTITFIRPLYLSHPSAFTLKMKVPSLQELMVVFSLSPKTLEVWSLRLRLTLFNYAKTKATNYYATKLIGKIALTKLVVFCVH